MAAAFPCWSAQVLAASNKQLQVLVSQIVAAGSSGNAASLADLSTQISKLAAVQQDEMTTSIATLASKIAGQYAADPSGYDPSLELAEFSDVSCICHFVSRWHASSASIRPQCQRLKLACLPPGFQHSIDRTPAVVACLHACLGSPYKQCGI
jgi:hypothetical protein